MKKEKTPLIGAVTALFGALVMLLGYYRGEADTVFEKAIRICLECIGIG